MNILTPKPLETIDFKTDFKLKAKRLEYSLMGNTFEMQL